MGIINKERRADSGQRPVGGVEKGIGGLVVLRAYPLALEYSPQRLRDVEVQRGFSPWVFPYTLISCGNADKSSSKRWASVSSIRTAFLISNKVYPVITKIAA